MTKETKTQKNAHLTKVKESQILLSHILARGAEARDRIARVIGRQEQTLYADGDTRNILLLLEPLEEGFRRGWVSLASLNDGYVLDEEQANLWLDALPNVREDVYAGLRSGRKLIAKTLSFVVKKSAKVAAKPQSTAPETKEIVDDIVTKFFEGLTSSTSTNSKRLHAVEDKLTALAGTVSTLRDEIKSLRTDIAHANAGLPKTPVVRPMNIDNSNGFSNPPRVTVTERKETNE